jgi:hypothetical protein
MKSSTLDIKLLPLNQLRIDKLPLLRKLGEGAYFKNSERPTINEKLVFCSEYTGISYDDIEQYSVKSINTLFESILSIVGEYQPKPLPKTIEVFNNTYKLVRRFNEQSAAWHRLVRQSDFKENPIRIASLCYIEKGMKYAQTGTHDIISNPTADRDEIFTHHLPLDIFLDLSDFFLKSFPEYYRLLMKMQKARKLITEDQMKKLKSQQ